MKYTLAQDVSPPGAPEGQTFCEITNDGVTEPRHWPDKLTALHYLVGAKLRMGDTLVMAGADEGRTLTLKTIFDNGAFRFDCAGTQVNNPEDMIMWLNENLQPGDTVLYLHG